MYTPLSCKFWGSWDLLQGRPAADSRCVPLALDQLCNDIIPDFTTPHQLAPETPRGTQPTGSVQSLSGWMYLYVASAQRVTVLTLLQASKLNLPVDSHHSKIWKWLNTCVECLPSVHFEADEAGDQKSQKSDQDKGECEPVEAVCAHTIIWQGRHTCKEGKQQKCSAEKQQARPEAKYILQVVPVQWIGASSWCHIIHVILIRHMTFFSGKASMVLLCIHC